MSESSLVGSLPSGVSSSFGKSPSSCGLAVWFVASSRGFFSLFSTVGFLPLSLDITFFRLLLSTLPLVVIIGLPIAASVFSAANEGLLSSIETGCAGLSADLEVSSIFLRSTLSFLKASLKLEKFVFELSSNINSISANNTPRVTRDRPKLYALSMEENWLGRAMWDTHLNE